MACRNSPGTIGHCRQRRCDDPGPGSAHTASTRTRLGSRRQLREDASGDPHRVACDVLRRYIGSGSRVDAITSQDQADNGIDKELLERRLHASLVAMRHTAFHPRLGTGGNLSRPCGRMMPSPHVKSREPFGCRNIAKRRVNPDKSGARIHSLHSSRSAAPFQLDETGVVRAFRPGRPTVTIDRAGVRDRLLGRGAGLLGQAGDGFLAIGEGVRERVGHEHAAGHAKRRLHGTGKKAATWPRSPGRQTSPGHSSANRAHLVS